MNEPASDPIRHVHAEPRMEWLVCNALGGYASGTVGGLPTRRYHGYLIAALPNPAGRVMMLPSLSVVLKMQNDERSRVDVGWVPPSFSTGDTLELCDFRLELGLPIWTF